MDSNQEYTEFLKKVERTIYLGNIFSEVTESILKAAFNQFGSVVGVEFIPAYLQPNGVHVVLLEMENRKQAEDIITEMDHSLSMVDRMPRSVRAMPARVEMFVDSPRKPGQRIQCKWLPFRDPQFDLAKKIQKVARRHAEEAAFLLDQQVEEEEDLAKSQSDFLKVNYKKLELIEGVDLLNS